MASHIPFLFDALFVGYLHWNETGGEIGDFTENTCQFGYLTFCVSVEGLFRAKGHEKCVTIIEAIVMR